MRSGENVNMSIRQTGSLYIEGAREACNREEDDILTNLSLLQPSLRLDSTCARRIRQESVTIRQRVNRYYQGDVCSRGPREQPRISTEFVALGRSPARPPRGAPCWAVGQRTPPGRPGTTTSPPLRPRTAFLRVGGQNAGHGRPGPKMTRRSRDDNRVAAAGRG